MTTTLKRAAAVLAAVLGLTLTIGGLWLATRVGTSSTATFTGKPQSAGAVLLTPQVLNRLDADVRMTATAQGGGRVLLVGSVPVCISRGTVRGVRTGRHCPRQMSSPPP